MPLETSDTYQMKTKSLEMGFSNYFKGDTTAIFKLL